MKRIIDICLDNYKAYIRQFSFQVANGENVLLYGENGSGKSSLYKAIRYFLSSSVGVGQFELNKYSGRKSGNITLSYIDIDPISKQPIKGTEQQFCVSTEPANTNNVQQFIQLSYRVSGFLDYTQLLRAYFAGGKRPDLFSLITDLISDHIPVREGMAVPFIKEMHDFLREIHNSYHRSDWAYNRGINRFKVWKAVFMSLMTQLNHDVSYFMKTYFPDLNIRISLDTPEPQLVDDGLIRNSRIDAHVYVDVEHYGHAMMDYNDTLNEARLSAIAICLYLASLKLKTDNIESKILYLDDIFLGLDLGNRKPILDIILQEFSDYQTFISTYDRSWYVQAKGILEDKGGWIFYELYEGTSEILTGDIIANPIIVKDDSSFGRACAYLNDNEHPDYPAAANYLRKAFEELLQKHFYEPAVREEQCELIPVFKLTQLVNACRGFVSQLSTYFYTLTQLEKMLTELRNTLHPLLHPLSHYAPDVPVYKAEVVRAIRLYQQILQELENADFNNHCRVFQERGMKAKLLITGVSKWQYIYTIKLLEPLYLYDDNKGGRSISRSECRVISIEESAPGMNTKRHQIDEKNKLANVLRYTSLDECYSKLVNFLAIDEKKTDAIVVSTENAISFPDVSNVHHSMKNMILGFVW